MPPRAAALALAAAMAWLAGCASPAAEGQGIEAVRVEASPGDGGSVLLRVHGGSADPATVSGIGQARPFDGRLEAQYFAGMATHPQHAGLVHEAAHRVAAAGFQRDGDAAFYNEAARSASSAPFTATDDAWVLRLRDDGPFACGGFYFVEAEVAVDGRTFTRRSDFHMPAC